MPTGAPLQVCHVIHSLERGGAEQVLVDLATAAHAAGMEMSVVSLTPITDRGHAQAIERQGVAVANLARPNRWDLRTIGQAARVIRRMHPDVVHTHLKHADLVGGFAAARLGVPQVSTLHLVESDVGGIAWLKRDLTARARHRSAARTIAVSDALRDWYLQTYRADPRKVVTIRNGVGAPPLPADGRVEALRRELGADPQTVLAAMVGLFRPGKGHADAISAMELLPAGSALRLVLVGDGPLRAEVDARIASSPARGRIHVAGYRDDVPALLAASDIVVHPSHFDALPTALISAAAAGRPVVATKVGGIGEIVVDGSTGTLVEPRDIAGLAAAMDALARDPDRRRTMGVAAEARFAREFDARIWAGRLAALYADVLRERRAACA